jgi:Uma2 family endonuclease
MSVVVQAAQDEEVMLPRVSWDEYVKMENPPGYYFEYDEGRLIVSPTATNAHNQLLAILAWLLGQYDEETDGRYCVFSIEHSHFMPPERRDFQPDVGILTDERKDRPLDPAAWIEGAPNIAVEVLSPSTEKRDRTFKARRYFEQGTSECWLFDPLQETAEFLRRGAEYWEPAAAEGGEYRTPLLPGFTLSLPDLWRRLRKKLRKA